MNSCILCEKKITLLNRPTFGLGKLNDGNEICYNCFQKLHKIDMSFARNLKIRSTNEVIDKLNLPKTDNNIQGMVQQHWYDKTWLVILLLFLFFPIGLYALWKSSKISMGWKIVGTAIITIIIIAALNDSGKNEIVSEKSKTTDPQVSPTTQSPSPAVTAPTVSPEEQANQKLNEQLKREIASFEKPFDGSTYRESVESLQIEIALFSVWANIINEGQNSSNEENRKLSNELKRKVSVRQVSEFPKIRKAYGDLVATKLWESNIYVSTMGSSKSIINLSGGLFADNKNIAETQRTLSEVFTQFRFKEIRYRWYKESDEFTYYKLETPKDNEIIEVK